MSEPLVDGQPASDAVYLAKLQQLYGPLWREVAREWPTQSSAPLLVGPAAVSATELVMGLDEGCGG